MVFFGVVASAFACGGVGVVIAGYIGGMIQHVRGVDIEEDDDESLSHAVWIVVAAAFAAGFIYARVCQ